MLWGGFEHSCCTWALSIASVYKALVVANQDVRGGVRYTWSCIVILTVRS